MTRRKPVPCAAALLAAILLLVSCSPEEAELTTTTTTAPSSTTTTEASESTTTTAEASTDGEDTGSQPAITDYEIVVRSNTTDGEILWLLIDPGDYTDVDLENLIREIVEETDVTLDGINVFDDLDALEAGRVDAEARTEDEQALVDEHHLVSLVDGAVIRFEGPYAEFGEIAVGS